MNEIYLINDKEERRRVETIPKVNITFYGENSLIEFHENMRINNMNLLVGENVSIKFGKNLMVRFSVNLDARAKNTKIVFGDNANLSQGHIFAGDEDNLEIIVGNNFLTALNFVLRNADGHTIYNLDDKTKPINKPKFGIHIGDNVWLGYNVIISKDVIIPNNVIVGAGSIVTKHQFLANSIIAGVPAKTIKTNIGWDSRSITKYLSSLNLPT